MERKTNSVKHKSSNCLATPALRHHKASGQGYVVLNGKAVYLGIFGEQETLEKYHQVIAEWLTSGRQLPVDSEQITINEILARFWVHAKNYYRYSNGKTTSEVKLFRCALRPLKELYGHSSAGEFGPKCLKVIRQQLVEKDLSRKYINKTIMRIKQVFKWAVAEELIRNSKIGSKGNKFR